MTANRMNQKIDMIAMLLFQEEMDNSSLLTISACNPKTTTKDLRGLVIANP
jgi:hypothetical protein